MKAKASKWLDVSIESINYLIVNYALSNMAMLLKNNPIFILFFASEIWVMGNYWRKIYDLTKNKVISTVLLIVCSGIHIGMVYFIGHIVGEIVPFHPV